ncbi:MAG: endonuclease III domain-containing protein [Nitrospirota bacterium]
MSYKDILENIYKRLFERYGSQDWWPADSPFEVIIGAILTQNTSWKNVEKAIQNLKEKNVLAPYPLYRLSEMELASLIKPSGYYNIKAGRLKNFLDFFFNEFEGDINRMFSKEMESLRKKLLMIKGIGEETADSILLYAGEYPAFVIDNYTRKILIRHNVVGEGVSYQSMRLLFMNNLCHDVQMFNEYHALIVKVGKDLCRKIPLCDRCVLRGV